MSAQLSSPMEELLSFSPSIHPSGSVASSLSLVLGAICLVRVVVTRQCASEPVCRMGALLSFHYLMGVIFFRMRGLGHGGNQAAISQQSPANRTSRESRDGHATAGGRPRPPRRPAGATLTAPAWIATKEDVTT
jgi:hypothetical protein